MDYEISQQQGAVCYAAEIPVAPPNAAACTGPPVMPLLTRNESPKELRTFYETANTHCAGSNSFGVALRSLKRYKGTKEYRDTLREKIAKATEQTSNATTLMEQRLARVTVLECSLELEELMSGQAPSGFHGHVKFAMPEPE